MAAAGLIRATESHVDSIRGLELRAGARWVAQNRLAELAVPGSARPDTVTMMGQRSAYRQMAHFLCELYFRFERVGLARDGGYELQLTQEQIGQALGLSAVHVNRSLQALRRDGLIKSNRSQVFIPDLDALVQVAQFDPAYMRLVSTG